MTTYYETYVDADSEEEARQIFANGGIGDCWASGDAGDAELQYCDEIKIK